MKSHLLMMFQNFPLLHFPPNTIFSLTTARHHGSVSLKVAQR
jgi:hypothetical protein